MKLSIFLALGSTLIVSACGPKEASIETRVQWLEKDVREIQSELNPMIPVEEVCYRELRVKDDTYSGGQRITAEPIPCPADE